MFSIFRWVGARFTGTCGISCCQIAADLSFSTQMGASTRVRKNGNDISGILEAVIAHCTHGASGQTMGCEYPSRLRKYANKTDGTIMPRPEKQAAGNFPRP